MLSYDPIELAIEMEKIVTRDRQRRYYRTSRPGKWYGGIASADCSGCNLRCVFCWSGAPRDNPGGIGKFYAPDHIFERLTACADKHGYRQLRVSGNEPTIGREHLLALLELVSRSGRSFILETNGILIGMDAGYAKQLSQFENLHVRVSLKGTSEEEFARLTGSNPSGFNLQLSALGNLVDAGVPCHPAVMLSFSERSEFRRLVERIRQIDAKLADEIEEEYVFLYPHVSKRMETAGITPKKAYSPGGIPQELI